MKFPFWKPFEVQDAGRINVMLHMRCEKSSQKQEDVSSVSFLNWNINNTVATLLHHYNVNFKRALCCEEAEWKLFEQQSDITADTVLVDLPQKQVINLQTVHLLNTPKKQSKSIFKRIFQKDHQKVGLEKMLIPESYLASQG